MGFFKQDSWSGLLFLPPGIPTWITSTSPASLPVAGRFSTTAPPGNPAYKIRAVCKKEKKKNRAGENLNLGVGCLQLWLLQARLTTAIKADHRERALGKAYCVCPGVREQWAWRRLLNHMLLKCLYLLWHTMQQSKGGHGIRHGIKTDWNEVLEKQRVEGHINSVP